MVVHEPSRLRGPLTQHKEHWHRESDAKLEPLTSEAGIRVDLVKRIRAEIAKGTYDTPEKFEAALLEMLRRLELD